MRGAQGAPPAALGPGVAHSCAAALLWGAPAAAAASADLPGILGSDLFPDCCYLALAACSPPRVAAPRSSASRSPSVPLLLSGNLLAQPAAAAAPGAAAGGAPVVHAAERSMAGASILAMRPKALALPAASERSSISGSGSGPSGTLFSSAQLARYWGDVAAARQHWGAADFLCLPFKLLPDSSSEAGSSGAGDSSSDGGSSGGQLALALLLGVPQVAADSRQRQAQQRQQMRSMLRLVAALARHAAPQLRQVSEVLRVLQPRPRLPPPLESVPEGDEEAEWGSSSAEEADSPTSRTAAAAGAAAAVDAEPEPASGTVPAPPLAAAAAAEQAAPLVARARQLGALCWLTVRQTVALPHALRLDALLRFRGAEQGGEAGAGALGPAVPPPPGDSALERDFLAYHSAMMANKMDAAASLLLLSILILLAKERNATLRIGHPLTCTVAAILSLPLLALVPGSFRAWYVARREHVLLAFFLCALLFQQATTNHIDSHVTQTAQSRSVNAGFAWITVDGLLLQMRLCRQLPTLLLCFLVNVGVAPAFCERYHAHLPPARCLVQAMWRGLLCLVAPLCLLYLLELRLRRDFFLQRRNAAAREEAALAAQRQQLRAQRLQERRHAERRMSLADGGTGS